MNKEQLIADAARRSGLTQREVRDGLNAAIEALAHAFVSNTNVAIAGLGTFQVRKRCNVRKYLPENGKGPVKGVTGGRTMVVINDRRYIQFNPAPFLKEMCMDKSPRNNLPEDRGGE